MPGVETTAPAALFFRVPGTWPLAQLGSRFGPVLWLAGLCGRRSMGGWRVFWPFILLPRFAWRLPHEIK